MAKLGKKLGPTGTLVFYLVFAAVGFIFVVIGIVKIYEANSSSSWPAVTGKIISCEVKKSNGKGGRHGKKGRNRTPHYYAAISYQYNVDGKEHMDERVSFGSLGGSMADAKMTADRYTVDSEVQVFYNPENHNEAVLEPGMHGSILTLPGVGAFFLVVGLGLALYQQKSRKKAA